MLKKQQSLWLTLPLLSLLLYGCAQPSSSVTIEPVLIGEYVSADYANRSDGYDWMAVRMVKIEEKKIAVSVRSRHDIKKPTCTFDAYAQKTDAQTYTAMANGQPVTLTTTPQALTISSPQPEGVSPLAYFCSGGASLEGRYEKLQGTLDQRQLDPGPFKAER